MKNNAQTHYAPVGERWSVIPTRPAAQLVARRPARNGTAEKKPALLLALCIVLFAIIPHPSHAYNNDAALEGDGMRCLHQVVRSEREYGIPQRLLSAIAATETGRHHKGMGIRIPWPWTINVEGKPYFFDTKREAVQAVERFQAQGIRSIDVGCMQVNLRHHPQAFANLSHAFEPRYNVDYAARFLRSHYDETRSWREAVGRYHSRTPGHAARYIAAVYGQWHGLASKGNMTARSSRYQSYVRLEGADRQVNFNDSSSPRRVVTPATPSDERVIKATTRENVRSHYDLSIIRPASAAGKIQTAPTQNVADASNPLVTTAESEKVFTSPKVLSISSGARMATDERIIRFVD